MGHYFHAFKYRVNTGGHQVFNAFDLHHANPASAQDVYKRQLRTLFAHPAKTVLSEREPPADRPNGERLAACLLYTSKGNAEPPG